jgi:hypothetical protein
MPGLVLGIPRLLHLSQPRRSMTGRRAAWRGQSLERTSASGIDPGRRSAMPIYHFDIADGVRLEDPIGLDCSSERDAKRAADLIARQIASDLDADGEKRAVVVVDEAGSEIYKVAVKRDASHATHMFHRVPSAES